MTQYSRQEMESGLPPLRLPKEGEDPSAFEKELDRRLASLAEGNACTPQQCVALASWLGDQGWKAFAVDDSDYKTNPTSDAFWRTILMFAAEQSEKDKSRAVPAKTLGGIAWKWVEDVHPGALKESSMQTAARQHRARFPRGGESTEAALLQMVGDPENNLPLEEVSWLLRQRLDQEIKRSAARLHSA